MKIYGIKTCDTCRKARKALPDAQFHDMRESPLDSATIARFLDAFGDALVNKSSTTWRGLSDDDRNRPAADLLAGHPTLMKRPVIDTGSAVFLGWKPDVQAALGV
ncbi:arsenate reductase [Roseinatronobacter sp. HJB301]|uniref:Arsenate reductase n=1 Tax=Roseinatronobacter alkalisoli TaxID=3028235 RepID=A0ABT5T307_9RHOB|nr:ArsC/Spx/MgsR family protein [Roseinatronobacter sp. HJB301]MDD7969507.1 arsenate reductase [Roseinatronobacter sp. HJB301]